MNDYLADAMSLIEMEYMEESDDLDRISKALADYRSIVKKLEKEKREAEDRLIGKRRKLSLCYERIEWMRSPRYRLLGSYGIDKELMDILP
jgi:hypothetical protein